MITNDLLDILCGPATKADLVLEGNSLISTDKDTRYRYKIEDDIPIMLIDEAEKLDLETWTEIMKNHSIRVD